MNSTLVTRLVLSLAALLTLLSTGCGNAQTPKTDDPILRDVSNDEFQTLMTQLEGALLLDVRTPDEWNEGHLAGAAHADYWGDEKAFEEAMNSIPRDRPVLVYCAGGGRSGLTAKELIAAGHREVYNLEHGISGWEADGLPVVQGPPADF
jgi:rhodanese-related sulfurtransferase